MAPDLVVRTSSGGHAFPVTSIAVSASWVSGAEALNAFPPTVSRYTTQIEHYDNMGAIFVWISDRSLRVFLLFSWNLLLMADSMGV